MNKGFQKRNELIYQAVIDGSTLSSLSNDYGISIARVRQIYLQEIRKRKRTRDDLYYALFDAANSEYQNRDLAELMATRAYRALKRSNINSLEEIKNLSKTKVLQIRNVGAKTANIVLKALEAE